MLNFKKIELESIEVLHPYLSKSTNRLCDFSVGGMVMWRDAFESEYDIYEGGQHWKKAFMPEAAWRWNPFWRIICPKNQQHILYNIAY